MHCRVCKNGIKDNLDFCPECGSRIRAGVNQENTIEFSNESWYNEKNSSQSEVIMFCPKCGKELKEGAKFCAFCGAQNLTGAQNTQSVPLNTPYNEAPYSETAPINNDYNNNGYNQYNSGITPPVQNKSKKTGAIIAVVIVIMLAAAGVLVWLLCFNDDGGKNDGNTMPVVTTVEHIETYTEPDPSDNEPLDETAIYLETAVEEVTTAAEETETEPEETEPEPEEPKYTPFEEAMYATDQRLLVYDDIKDFDSESCRLLRNSIYARHGRKFKDSALHNFFIQYEWYYPLYDSEVFDESVLNFYESENIKFIVAFENDKGYR